MNPLTTRDFTQSDEPFTLFKTWLTEAEASEPNDPNAMALATVDETGLPNVRMVLLKGFEQSGLRLREFAALARLPKGTMTKMVRLVERNGLVRG